MAVRTRYTRSTRRAVVSRSSRPTFSRQPRPKAVTADVATTAGRWLVWSQSSGAVGDLPTTRDEDLEREVGFGYAGPNRKRRAHPAAGSSLFLAVQPGRDPGAGACARSVSRTTAVGRLLIGRVARSASGCAALAALRSNPGMPKSATPW